MSVINIIADAFAKIESKKERVVSVLAGFEAKNIMDVDKDLATNIDGDLLWGAKIVELSLEGISHCIICVGLNGTTEIQTLIECSEAPLDVELEEEEEITLDDMMANWEELLHLSEEEAEERYKLIESGKVRPEFMAAFDTVVHNRFLKAKKEAENLNIEVSSRSIDFKTNRGKTMFCRFVEIAKENV